MADPNNVTLRLASNGGVDRTLSYEELDANFLELITIINDHDSLDAEVTTAQNNITTLQSNVTDLEANKLDIADYDEDVLKQELLKEATLSFDFVTDTYYVNEGLAGDIKAPFEQLASFTRGSSASGYAVGKLATVTNDVKRLVRDPATGKREGLLIEEQRTNLLRNSENFVVSGTPWGVIGTVNIDANAEVAPDGTNTADRITDGDTGSAALISQVVGEASVSGATYTASIYIKADTSNEITFNAYVTGENENNLWIDTATGEVTQTGGTGLLDFGVEKIGNGWLRVHIVFDSQTDGGNIQFRLWPTSRIDFTRTGAVFVWGAQLEQGAFPTSYIKTEGSQVTRSADTCNTDLLNEINKYEGTIFVEFERPSSGAIGSSGIFSLESGSISDSIFSVSNSSGLNEQFVYRKGGSNVEVFVRPYLTGKNKIAVSYNNDTMIFVVNGDSVVRENGPYDIPEFDILKIAAFSSGRLNGAIKDVRLFPRAMTNSEVIALTK